MPTALLYILLWVFSKYICIFAANKLLIGLYAARYLQFRQ